MPMTFTVAELRIEMERAQQGPEPLIGREMLQLLLLFRFGISLLRKAECTNIHQHTNTP